MKKEDVISVINKVIFENRDDVLKALRDSNVVIPILSSEKEISDIVIKELHSGNGYLAVYLGEVIDSNKSNKSDFIGAVIAGGQMLYGMYKGSQAQKAAKKAAASQLASDRAKAARLKKEAEEFKKQMAIAASKREADRIRSDSDIKSRKAKTNRTIIIVSIIGFSLLIGGVTFIKIIKK